MKVSTIACIFGALIKYDDPRKILDIGTGTGLLTLMLSQKFKSAYVDAIEIEENAYYQSCDNFNRCEWTERINPIHGDFLEYHFNTTYDLIISNPPFFKNHLRTNSEEVNLARHSDHISIEKFTIKVSNLLSYGGEFWIILPPFEMKFLKENLNRLDFYIKDEIQIQNFKYSKNPLALVASFTAKPVIDQVKKTFIIKNNEEGYTEEFKEILKEFYLYL